MRPRSRAGTNVSRFGDALSKPGFPWFVCVARGRVRLYQSEHKGDARPDTLIHLHVNDPEAVSEELGIPLDEEWLAGRNATV